MKSKSYLELAGSLINAVPLIIFGLALVMSPDSLSQFKKQTLLSFAGVFLNFAAGSFISPFIATSYLIPALFTWTGKTFLAKVLVVTAFISFCMKGMSVYFKKSTQSSPLLNIPQAYELIPMVSMLLKGFAFTYYPELVLNTFFSFALTRSMIQRYLGAVITMSGIFCLDTSVSRSCALLYFGAFWGFWTCFVDLKHAHATNTFDLEIFWFSFAFIVPALVPLIEIAKPTKIKKA